MLTVNTLKSSPFYEIILQMEINDSEKNVSLISHCIQRTLCSVLKKTSVFNIAEYLVGFVFFP